MTSSSCNSYNINTIKSQTFFFWPKNKGPLTLSKFFPYLLFFPSIKFWSSYIAWLYIKRTKLHTKGLFNLLSLISFRLISTLPLWSFLSDSSSLTLLCRNFTHFAAKYTFSHFPISLTKPLFIDNNTTHILQHTIIHCSSFRHSIILKLHHFCCSKHISISFFISHTKSPFLESNIINVITQKTTPTATFATFNFHIIHLTLPYIFHTHSPRNTHTYLSYIFKSHVSQSVYIYI